MTRRAVRSPPIDGEVPGPVLPGLLALRRAANAVQAMAILDGLAPHLRPLVLSYGLRRGIPRDIIAGLLPMVRAEAIRAAMPRPEAESLLALRRTADAA